MQIRVEMFRRSRRAYAFEPGIGDLLNGVRAVRQGRLAVDVHVSVHEVWPVGRLPGL